jgi:DNA modification methylase
MCGSGTTLVAALKKGCKPMGFELLERNYNTAISRVADALNAKDAGKLELVGDTLVED